MSSLARRLRRLHVDPGRGPRVLPTAVAAETPRAAFAKLLREIADRVESGELRGARTQWRDGQTQFETVECLPAELGGDPGSTTIFKCDWKPG